MFYRLFDLQTGRFMSTGYNAESKEDLVSQYIEYISADGSVSKFKKMSVDEVFSMIESNDFSIEESEVPFHEDEEDDCF
jgi:hypothetical protein